MTRQVSGFHAILLAACGAIPLQRQSGAELMVGEQTIELVFDWALNASQEVLQGAGGGTGSVVLEDLLESFREKDTEDDIFSTLDKNHDGKLSPDELPVRWLSGTVKSPKPPCADRSNCTLDKTAAHPWLATEAQRQKALHIPDNGQTELFFHNQKRYHTDDASPVWKQRFYAVGDYCETEDCPVFVMVGGESQLKPVKRDRLFMVYLAKEMGAMVFAVEHRYYGRSWPVPDMSLENLRWLTSTQALADLAALIRHLKALPPGEVDNQITIGPDGIHNFTLKHSLARSRWVTFGCSYPAVLSAHMRLQYPGLVSGAISSSGPMQPVLNLRSYYAATAYAHTNHAVGGSEQCMENLAKANRQVMEVLTSTVPWGTDLPGPLKVCDGGFKSGSTMLDHTNVELLYYQQQVGIAWSTQENGLYDDGVRERCKSMTDESLPLLERLSNVVATFRPGKPCINTTDVTMEDVGCDGADCVKHRNATFDPDNNQRQWYWQTCNEFGYYQTFTGMGPFVLADGTPYPSPWEAFGAVSVQQGLWMCEHVYNVSSDRIMSNIASTAKRLGGRHLPNLHNVTFVNGNADPWHSIGVTPREALFHQNCQTPDGSREFPLETPAHVTSTQVCTKQTVSPHSDVVLIDGACHCRDIYAPNMFPGIGGSPEAVGEGQDKIKASVYKYAAAEKCAGQGPGKQCGGDLQGPTCCRAYLRCQYVSDVWSECRE